MAGELRQRRWGYALRFEPGDEGFRYTVRDGGTEHSFVIAYERVDLARSMLVRVPATKPFVILYFVAALLLSITFALNRVPGAAVVVFVGLFGLALLGMVLWRTSGLFAVPFTVFADDHGGEAFRVIRDKQHDRIVATLTAFRRDRLRQLWATPGIVDDLAAERARFDWLLLNDIIDESEHAAAVRRMAAGVSAEPRPSRLH